MIRLENVQVDQIELDPDNPRLPESLVDRSQASLLNHLYHFEDLTELARSFISNGFWENDPPILLPLENGHHVVLEGNRRIAALQILLQLPVARDAGLDFEDLAGTSELIRLLQVIPAFETEDRHDVEAYLGYRHISGLRTWAPSAKARYIYLAVEESVAKGDSNPFYSVGRKTGSNAQGIRTSYNCYNVLRYARDDLGLVTDAEYIINNKFGVWTRLLSTANIPQYIGLADADTSYESTRKRVESIYQDRIREVLNDLIPKGPSGRAILQDSRDATDYSIVIMDDNARETLRKYGDLQLALRSISTEGPNRRLKDIVNISEVFYKDILSFQQIQTEDVDLAERLVSISQLIRGALRDSLSSEIPGEDGQPT